MALRQAIRGEVRFDAVSRMLYRTDASIYEMEPLGLVVPKDEADVVAAVKIAAEQGRRCCRGAAVRVWLASRWGRRSISTFPNT